MSIIKLHQVDCEKLNYEGICLIKSNSVEFVDEFKDYTFKDFKEAADLDYDDEFENSLDEEELKELEELNILEEVNPSQTYTIIEYSIGEEIRKITVAENVEKVYQMLREAEQRDSGKIINF